MAAPFPPALRASAAARANVASQALLFRRTPMPGRASSAALVNGAPGIVTLSTASSFSVMGFTVADGKIVEIDILADPARLARLDLGARRLRVSFAA